MSRTSLSNALFVRVCLHDQAGNPSRLAAAALASVLEEDRDRDDRLAVLEREADEPAVVLRLLAVLRRTGLTTHVQTRDPSAAAGAVVGRHDAEHHVLQLVRHAVADRRAQFLG